MFTDLFRMLDQEALVVRSCLAAGLTDVRNANLHDKGRFYSAFYQLSIGIERFTKLALILDHLAQNNLRAPGHATVRFFGHDLQALLSTVEQAAGQRGYSLAAPFVNTPLSQQLLAFLSDFAKGMRYANLDGLASGARQRNPLADWAQIAAAAAANLPRSTTRRIVGRSAAIGAAIADITMVVDSGLDEAELTTETALSQPALLDAIAKLITWELISLIAPSRDCVVEAGHAADRTQAARDGTLMNIPAMSEYFDFLWLDRQYVFRKRKWP